MLMSRRENILLIYTQAKYFEDEVHPEVKHTKAGLLCMASAGENMNTSQFYITMRGEDLEVRARMDGSTDGSMDQWIDGWMDR